VTSWESPVHLWGQTAHDVIHDIAQWSVVRGHCGWFNLVNDKCHGLVLLVYLIEITVCQRGEIQKQINAKSKNSELSVPGLPN
jgi:hypothetical protein